MALSFVSRLFRGGVYSLLALGIFGMVPTAVSAVGMCNCACQDSSGAPGLPGGPSCQTHAVCNYTMCRAYCATAGAAHRPTRTGQCVGGTDAPTEGVQVGSTPAPAPAPAPSGRGTPAPAPSSGSGSGEAPRQGACQFRCSPSGAPGTNPDIGNVRVTCTSDRDCIAACTNRCTGGPSQNGLTPGTGLVCSTAMAPTCVFASDAPAPDAAPGSSGGGGGALRFVLPSCTNDGNCSLTDIVNTGVRFANFLLGLSGIVFLGTFLYAGASIILFANDEASFKKAKGMLQGAVVGVVIVMVAGVAVRFVSSSLGVNQALLRTPGTTRAPAPPPPLQPPATP